MERLTKCIGFNGALFACVHFRTMNCAIIDPDCSTENCGQCDFYGDMINKLGRYEDTGLSPEEVMELIKKKG